MDAVQAVSGIDGSESIAHDEQLKLGADTRQLREAASYAYLDGALDGNRLDQIELSESVTDEHVERIRDEISDLPDDLDDDALPEGFTIEDIEEAAAGHGFTDEQLRTVIELESRIDNVRASKEAELKLINEGEVGHAAVALLLVVVVAYTAVYNN